MADRAYKHQHTCAACGFVASGATNVSGVGTAELDAALSGDPARQEEG